MQARGTSNSRFSGIVGSDCDNESFKKLQFGYRGSSTSLDNQKLRIFCKICKFEHKFQNSDLLPFVAYSEGSHSQTYKTKSW